MTSTIRLSRTAARRTATVVATVGLVAALAACGGSGSTSTATSAPAGGPTGAPASGAGGGGFRRIDAAQLQQIRECLTAAGIADPLPSALPSFPGQRPSFSGPRPSFSPGDRPSGFPSGRGGFGGGFAALLQNPQAKAALDACGIALPSFGPRNGQGGPGTPSAG